MKTSKRLITAILTTLVITPVIAYAEDTVRSYSKNVTIHYGVKVTKGGELVDLIDSNGKKVDAFIYEDTAYVPLKTLAPLLGGSTQYNPENNSVDIFDQDQSSFISGYLAALKGTPVSDEISKKIISYGYVPTHLSGQSSVSIESDDTEILSFEDFYMDTVLKNHDQYVEMVTDYYNMGSQRMEDINNGTAQNNEAWQALYDSLGEQLASMGELPDINLGYNSSANSYTFPLHLYSNDGKVYLGKCVTDSYDDESIWYGLELAGDYSSPYSDTSIWNEYGEYGSSLISKDNSAFNDRADTPPIIVDNKGVFVAYLTTNEKIENGWTITELRQFVVNNNQ